METNVETITVVNMIVLLGIGVCIAGIVVMRRQIAKTQRKLKQLKAHRALSTLKAQ